MLAKKASIPFDDEPRNRLHFNLLLDISAAPRPQAVDCLERVSRTGISLVERDVTLSRIRTRDCGVEALVGISNKVLAFLDLCKSVVEQPLQQEAFRATVDTSGDGLIVIRFKKNSLELRGREKAFFLFLFWRDKKTGTFKCLWDDVIAPQSGKSYRQDPKGGGPPELLRRHKCSLNKRLTCAFGKPPSGEFWIEVVKSHGYQLNQKTNYLASSQGASQPL